MEQNTTGTPRSDFCGSKKRCRLSLEYGIRGDFHHSFSIIPHLPWFVKHYFRIFPKIISVLPAELPLRFSAAIHWGLYRP